ncbi:MAG: hypothetical protein LBC12_05140 [Nitrososphaerota archaeon]|jgi:hypothetical protein|nr:hypothetical protein [Nitrososphaerota archaeon]
MSSSSNTKPKRISSTKTKKNTTKTTNTKTKKSTTTQKKPTTTTKKTKTITKSVKEKTADAAVQNNSGDNGVKKALVNIEQFGNQTFARAPFSQYYDNWLNDLRQVVTDFETGLNVKVDRSFTKKCEQAFLNIQTALTEQHVKESALSKVKKDLQKVNQDLEKIDADYTSKKHELHNKQNTGTQKLIPQMKTLESDMAIQEKVKFGFFQFSAKKEAAKKLEQTKQDLKAVQTQIEVVVQNFAVEQSKLHDEYIAKKQDLSAKSDTLSKEVEHLEVDTSIKARKEICTSLINAINELVKRQTTKASK